MGVTGRTNSSTQAVFGSEYTSTTNVSGRTNNSTKGIGGSAISSSKASAGGRALGGGGGGARGVGWGVKPVYDTMLPSVRKEKACVDRQVLYSTVLYSTVLYSTVL